MKGIFMKKLKKLGTTETGRYLPIAVRSCGLQSPPHPDHYRQPSSNRTCLRGVGKFGIPSKSWINTVIKARQKATPCKCHRGIGIMSSSTYGNTASSWSESPQSPPSYLRMSEVDYEKVQI